MATFVAFLALALLIGGCVFVYRRSLAAANDADEGDLPRIRAANRELFLQRIDPQLWDAAMHLANGDEGVARARYLELRIRQMKEQEAAKEARPPG